MIILPVQMIQDSNEEMFIEFKRTRKLKNKLADKIFKKFKEVRHIYKTLKTRLKLQN